MTTIASTDNPRFRDLAKLQQSGRERRKSGLALLEGVHLVEAYHQQRGLPEQLIVNTERRHEAEIEALLTALAPLEALEFSAKLFARLSSVETPTGILALIKAPARSTIPHNPAPASSSRTYRIPATSARYCAQQRLPACARCICHAAVRMSGRSACSGPAWVLTSC
jgi:tRNA G18 (ribose-2'-O)-methylase SpoU